MVKSTPQDVASLHEAAARADRDECVRDLQAALDAGKAVNAIDNGGATALHYAAINSDPAAAEAAAQLLLDNGANVNSKHRDNGSQPLHWAAGSNPSGEATARVMQVLLAAPGADVHAVDTKRGGTALHWAAANGSPAAAVAAIEALRKAGADITTQSRKGDTAMGWADKNKKLAAARAAIKALQKVDGGKAGGAAGSVRDKQAGAEQMLIFKTLNLNVDNRQSRCTAASAQAALQHLIGREQPDVITLQECGWTKRGSVLAGRILVNEAAGSWEIVEKSETDSKRNTVIYNASKFAAETFTFEQLDITAPPLGRMTATLAERHGGLSWLPTRYVLLRLTSRAHGDLQFFVINWHGLWKGVKHSQAADITNSLLNRCTQLAQQAGLPVLLCGDFNYALGDKGHEDLPAAVSFTIHQPCLSDREAADAQYQAADVKAKRLEEVHKEQMAVRPVPKVADAYTWREEARLIRDAITPPEKRAQKGVIDFVCTFNPAAGRCAIGCSLVESCCLERHAGFDHGPQAAIFCVSLAPPQLGTELVTPRKKQPAVAVDAPSLEVSTPPRADSGAHKGRG